MMKLSLDSIYKTLHCISVSILVVFFETAVAVRYSLTVVCSNMISSASAVTVRSTHVQSKDDNNNVNVKIKNSSDKNLKSSSSSTRIIDPKKKKKITVGGSSNHVLGDVTVLMRAVAEDDISILLRILSSNDYQATLFARDKKGRTALDWARMCRNYQVG